MRNATMFKRFFRYLKPYWLQQIILFLFMVIANITGLVMPLATKFIIDDVFPGKDLNLLIYVLVFMMGIRIVGMINGFISSYIYTWVSSHIMMNMQCDLFNHLLNLPLSFYTKQKTGDIVHRVNTEINTVQSAVTNSIMRFANNLLMLTGLTIALCYLNWRLFLVTIVVLPFLLINIKYFHPKIRQITEISRRKYSDILGFFVERFDNMKLIQSYNRQDYELLNLKEKIKELIAIRYKSFMISWTTNNISGFLMFLAPTIIFAWGGYHVMKGTMTLGALFAYLQYSGRLYGPLRDLMSLYIDLVRSSVSMQRIFEYLDIPVSENGKNSNSNFTFNDKIVFDNVDFDYDGMRVLDNIAIELEKSKKYAIVGSSGCGKSTLINLLCRFHSHKNGNIFIDGMNIQDIDLFELRERIGLVTQDNQLFNDSVWENLRYGKIDATDAEITNYAKLIDLEGLLSDDRNGGDDKEQTNRNIEFVKRKSIKQRKQMIMADNWKRHLSFKFGRLDMDKFAERVHDSENGSNQNVGDKGMKLSGGQKQRIAIARVLLKKADILILDEATSALDSESEKAVFDNLKQLYHDKTMILISHRLSAVKDVDEILCMDKGRIVEKGTHDDLIIKKGFYHQLFKEQIE